MKNRATERQKQQDDIRKKKRMEGRKSSRIIYRFYSITKQDLTSEQLKMNDESFVCKNFVHVVFMPKFTFASIALADDALSLK